MAEMSHTKECPCVTVRELQETVEKQREKLVDCQINFAAINVKLNIVIGVLGAIGTALIGVIVKLIF